MARYSKQVSDNELMLVGHNCLQIPDEEDTLLKDVAETKFEPCWDQIEKIKQYKKSRDMNKIKAVLSDLKTQTQTEGKNLMYPIIEAFDAGATMEEIAGTMRQGYNRPYDPYGMRDSIL